MSEYGEPIAPPGPPIDIGTLVRMMQRLADLLPTEVVEAIHAGADAPDLADVWPELTAHDVAELRRQARAVTKSRLRAWSAQGERQPTWLDLRALITGLRRTLD